ncbi:MAG: response regulator [bacterium]|nr:response regulator [bacterium]MDD3805498.1 response regulator [bacterium]MDD4557399.1 response regulator [bacterium]
MSIKLLHIDDEADTVQMVKLALESEGFEVIPAYSGLEGIQKILLEKPDIILLDIMMPGLNGYDVLKALKQKPNPLPTPIVILSAKTAQEDIDRAMAYGATDYITKPFDILLLADRLRHDLAVGKETGPDNPRE